MSIAGPPDEPQQGPLRTTFCSPKTKLGNNALPEGQQIGRFTDPWPH
jgi:hypothetical protein